MTITKKQVREQFGMSDFFWKMAEIQLTFEQQYKYGYQAIAHFISAPCYLDPQPYSRKSIYFIKSLNDEVQEISKEIFKKYVLEYIADTV